MQPATPAAQLDQVLPVLLLLPIGVPARHNACLCCCLYPSTGQQQSWYRAAAAAAAAEKDLVTGWLRCCRRCRQCCWWLLMLQWSQRMFPAAYAEKQGLVD
jgi:hypothetical protein